MSEPKSKARTKPELKSHSTPERMAYQYRSVASEKSEEKTFHPVQGLPKRKGRRAWQSGIQICRLKRWDNFRKDVEARLRLLAKKEKRFIVIRSRLKNRFVQFASEAKGFLLGEAVSNSHLASDEKLTPAACRELKQLGWRLRTKRGGNFMRVWQRPLPFHELSSLVVNTLRDTFQVSSPSEIEIKQQVFEPGGQAVTKENDEFAPVHTPLRTGATIRNSISGREYQVRDHLGSGGFGSVYSVTQSGGEPLPGAICLKVAPEVLEWHREAYFGYLLGAQSAVVKVHESFAWVPGGKNRAPLYCLVSERVQDGDLRRYLNRYPEPWAEAKARREMIRLLRAVALLHRAGAVHRDITSGNILVGPNRILKLGDFGIALHRIGDKTVPADAFAPCFAPTAIGRGKTGKWRPADDVYQLGQLFAILLHGSTESKLTSRDVKALACSAEVKSVIQRCIGARMKRFPDASEVLAALEAGEASPKRRIISSLRGKRIVFTGRLAGLTRDAAKELVRKAGGIVESSVSHQTDVLVLGKQNPNWKADRKGQQLLDVDRERELGHHVAIVSERRFLTLAGASAL